MRYHFRLGWELTGEGRGRLTSAAPGDTDAGPAWQTRGNDLVAAPCQGRHVGTMTPTAQRTWLQYQAPHEIPLRNSRFRPVVQTP